MPTIKVLPHPQRCPQGALFEAKPGDNLIELLLAHDIEIEHACERSCACTTCHVIIRQGFDSLDEAADLEEDMLDKAWGLTLTSRLSCQVTVGEQDLLVEIPKYTINLASENH
ncbi:MAG: ISC system 2Fe-2S type ferredoxin [Pseudomonadales bacterium]|jgi:2Fe-2S ferredoxin|nr:ISC system 2Fe-2S type ferredoxin [Pseudomonadales bacterium]MCP5333610.1 ISC system 2Fe-2S type ferredoxin [Pseudomonadales bacterium]HMU89304.1 ISC system 2Fe-2S type ferredoxin [Pseudomonadales bacterium]HMW15100.1 ISC system 2Fe-2S type ferredoxin [Pseudomonadales bacterium]HMW82198.1 ISC system 2Fe-2S type ferredoxin [Pseudomonadales bacterium]